MFVDSTALPEQVIADVIVSAFQSAGQRCSALRLLCLQEEIAERVLKMLKVAMAELVIGDPAQFSSELGPVIDAAPRINLLAHIEPHHFDVIAQCVRPTACKLCNFAGPAGFPLWQ